MIKIASLYEFTKIKDCARFSQLLKEICLKNEIKGTLILAKEGINGTISGEIDKVNELLEFLTQDLRFLRLEYKESFAKSHPFYRMKVLVKKEIVTLGVDEVDPSLFSGEYVEPENWNDIVLDENFILVDTRNDYEVKIGSFLNAINPKTKTFREFPEFVRFNLDQKKDKKIAMFCTGGIRCEKSTSLLKMWGFEKVYHLRGGILKYLETVPQEKSLWKGDCFVFDQRVSLEELYLANKTLEKPKSNYIICHGCREPLLKEDLNSHFYEEGVSCVNCFNHLTENKKRRLKERQLQIFLSKQRGEQHLGKTRISKVKEN
jgi:UPF0176 protein